MIVPEDVPHIEAQCAHCGKLFDLKFDIDCPVCHRTGVRFARLIPARCGAETYKRLRTALDRITEWQAPEVSRDIAELDRIYALKDTRP